MLNGDLSDKGFYESLIEDTLAIIQELHSENSFFQAMRERHSDNWKVVETCREIMFLNAKHIRYFMAEIEYEREQVKKLS